MNIASGRGMGVQEGGLGRRWPWMGRSIRGWEWGSKDCEGCVKAGEWGRKERVLVPCDLVVCECVDPEEDDDRSDRGENRITSVSTPPSGMHVWRGLTAAQARPNVRGCCEVTCKSRGEACWPRPRLRLRRVRSTFGIWDRPVCVWKRRAHTCWRRVAEGATYWSCEGLTLSLPQRTFRLLMPPTTLAVSLPAAPGPRYPFKVRAFSSLKACLPPPKYAFHVPATPVLSTVCTCTFFVQRVSQGRTPIHHDSIGL